MDKPKREAILDLSKYANERIRVKFTGGREGVYARIITPVCCSILSVTVTGVLKGFDQLLNLVLDEVEENLETGTRALPYLCRARVDFPPQSQELRRARSVSLSSEALPLPCSAPLTAQKRLPTPSCKRVPETMQDEWIQQILWMRTRFSWCQVRRRTSPVFCMYDDLKLDPAPAAVLDIPTFSAIQFVLLKATTISA